MTSTDPPVQTVRWDRTYRLVPCRYPPIDLFERVAEPADWDLVAQIEGLTNDRCRDELGDISIVPLSERLTGEGASPIMAAFTQFGVASRFSDGSFGVYYASNSFEGALFEALHHRRQFLMRTAEPKIHFDLRTYVGRVLGELHDIRRGWPELHAPDSHVHSRALAKRLRNLGSNGIAFDSVRRKATENIAVFRPSILAASPGRPHVTLESLLRVEWDGSRMTRYIVMGEVCWKPL